MAAVRVGGGGGGAEDGGDAGGPGGEFCEEGVGGLALGYALGEELEEGVEGVAEGSVEVVALGLGGGGAWVEVPGA